MKSLLSFDETNFEFRGEQRDVLLWLTPDGDDLRLFHFPIPPDIEADLRDVAGVRAFYRRLASQSGLGVLEIDTGVADRCSVVRTLFKVAQEPAGRTYVGTLTFPFRAFSYVFKVESQELGITGSREAALLPMFMNSGKVSVNPEGNQLTGWLDDPYDLSEADPMTRNLSERPAYDSRFPTHPLSRARRTLNHLQATVKVDYSVKQQPKFA